MKKITLVLACIFMTVTYAQTPAFEWAKKIGGDGSEDIEAVAIDNAGNVYSTGFFTGTTDFDPGGGVVNLTSSLYGDMFITKMDPSGNLIWVKQIAGNGTEIGFSIFIDNTGNILLTGGFNGVCDFDPGLGTYNLTTNNITASFVLKLNAAGDFQWAHKTGETQGSYTNFVTADDAGNVFTSGTFTVPFDFDPSANNFILDPGTNPSAFITKFDANGTFSWTKIFNIPIGAALYSTPVAITSLATDAQGNIVAAGEFDQTVDFNPGVEVENFTTLGNRDCFILKLDSVGNYIWAKQFGAIAINRCQTLAIDASGDIYSAGRFEFETDFDPGAGVFNLNPYNLQNSGALYLLKLNASGEFVWAKNFGNYNVSDEIELVLDAEKNVYVAGEFNGTYDFDPTAASFSLTGVNDVFVAKYNTEGTFIWAVKFGGVGIDYVRSLVVDPNYNVYTVGYFYGTSDFDQTDNVFEMSAVSSNLTDGYIQKMSQQTLGIKSVVNNQKTIQVYPNPSNGDFIIDVDAIYIGNMVSVFNEIGQKIKTVPLQSLQTKVHLNPGFYILQLENGSQPFAHKVIVK